MKQVLRYIAVVMACVGLAGCGSRTVDARLAQVNDLANVGEADSAIVLLQAIEKTALDEYNSRYHDLMAIKTRDKTNADITGDTAIVDIMAYFEAEGPDEVRGEAYYYGGRVYREMGDAPQALDYYQKAQDAFPQDHAFMKGKIASQMGQIFLELYMHEHAKNKFQEAITYQNNCNDSAGVMLNILALGGTYKSLQINDSALFYFHKALNLAQKIDLLGQRELRIRASIINHYQSVKKYTLAKNEYNQIKSHFKKANNNEYILMTVLRMEIVLGEYQNAKEVASQLLNSTNLHVRKYVYETLADLIRYEGDQQLSYNYLKESLLCQDSINAASSRNAVIQQNSLYNYTLRERENLILKEELQLHYFIIVIAFFIIVIAVLIALYLYHKNKALKLELSLQLRNIDKLKTTTSLNNKDYINEENTSIKKLKETILLELNSLTDGTTLQNYQVNNNILNSSIYAKFRKRIEYKTEIITTQDWLDLDNLVNETHKDFRNKLELLNNKLSIQEYRICLLIKCGFSNKNISEIIVKSYSTIISNQKRLYEKISKQKGSASELMNLIYCI